MNLIQQEIFRIKKGTPVNTYIGGVSATISTPALLATRLGISVGRISNFTIVGSDIQCGITGSYGSLVNFDNVTSLSYFNDVDGLITSLPVNAFTFTKPDADYFIFPNVTSIGNNCFNNDNRTNLIGLIYIPRCTSIGTTVNLSADIVFGINRRVIKIYTHPSMSTINSGGVEADLAYTSSFGYTTISYVTNFTVPNPVTTLSAGTIYNTAIQLNFTPPSSTNAIEYYECYANGVKKNKITASGGYITGLTASTSYNITLIAVDIFYNKSVVSNTVTQATSTPSYTDTDANAYISATSLTDSEQESAYKLIVDLKSNSLWTKIQAIYPFKGTTAAQHKFNAKNPIDTDGAFRLTFNGAATFGNNGYQLNGSSYANTYFVPSAQQNVNSNGMTIVCGTNNAAYGSDVVDIGSFNSQTQKSYVVVKNNNTNYARVVGLNSTNISITGNDESRGIFTGTKQSATVTDLFIKGVQIATVSSGGTLPTVACFIGAMNLNGSQYGNSNQRIQIVIIHEGLSDGEVATLHSIIDLSETIAGRKTW